MVFTQVLFSRSRSTVICALVSLCKVLFFQTDVTLLAEFSYLRHPGICHFPRYNYLLCACRNIGLDGRSNDLQA